MSSRRKKSLPEGSRTAGTLPARAHRRNVCSLQSGIIAAASAVDRRSSVVDPPKPCKFCSFMTMSIALLTHAVK